MHRIDSATARENANGDGKTGFHDNADLPNQDATYFTPEWSNALQEEIANVIEGLELTLDKSDNGQLLKALVQQFGEKKVLENSIKEYKEMIKADRVRLLALEERTYEDTQIGEHIWTSEHFLTPEDVTEYKGYGEWERALQGRVAVGFSDDPADDIDFRTHGAEYGEPEHTLITDETPEHKHSKGDLYNRFSAKSSDVLSDPNKAQYIGAGSGLTPSGHDNDNTSTEYQTGQMSTLAWTESEEVTIGSGQPHNNMQPSKTLDCWKRVA
ncbi:phage baseplate protein [Psychrobacter sp. AT9]|uniref:phage baseplate protein n=1 Tax=Psychrobacter sp. AT9 TaxID=3242893 RepID=UPI0039A42089